MYNPESDVTKKMLSSDLASFLIWLFFVPITAAMAVLSLIVSAVDKSGRSYLWVARTWSRSALFISRVRLDVQGREHLKPDAVYIIVSNHASMFDIPAVLVGLNNNFRIIAKRELGSVPLLGLSLRRGDFILIGRTQLKNAADSLAKAEEKLHAGKSIFMFADGTRSEDGSIRPFKRGAFTLSAKTGVPILPVTILDSWKINRKGSYRIRSGTIRLIIGEAIFPDGSGRDAEKMLLEKAYNVVTSTYQKFSTPHAPEV
jgi:1-acyl-sn-glycerol-3-phosphate acyltransferase